MEVERFESWKQKIKRFCGCTCLHSRKKNIKLKKLQSCLQQDIAGKKCFGCWFLWGKKTKTNKIWTNARENR